MQKFASKYSATDFHKSTLHARFLDFSEKVAKKFGDKFQCVEETFSSTKDYMDIVCKDHGRVRVEAQKLLSAIYGCPKCTEDRQTEIHEHKAQLQRQRHAAAFLGKATAVHGDRYDYSGSVYTGANKKIRVVCKKHGEFLVTAGYHLSGSGCPQCLEELGIEERLQSFLSKAKTAHGDKYSYNTDGFTNITSKVGVVCPKHGETFQTAYDHICGGGCKYCGYEVTGKKLSVTLEGFLQKAKEVHGGRYDYSKVLVVKNASTEVVVSCLKHGEFKQSVKNHLNGRGCYRCGRDLIEESRRGTLKGFIKSALEVHRGRYGYDEAIYVNATTPVRIRCKEHGVFKQSPSAHLAGQGCPVCGASARGMASRHTVEEFIRLAREVHGDKYDYSKAAYEGTDTPVTLVCAEHGEFQQRPSNHIKAKHGCPTCADYGYRPGKPGMLYYLRVVGLAGELLYKVGITNVGVDRRFRFQDLKRITTIRVWPYEDGTIPRALEAEILREFKDFQYQGPDILSSGNTELFTQDILNLDYNSNQGYNQPIPTSEERNNVRNRPS